MFLTKVVYHESAYCKFVKKTQCTTGNAKLWNGEKTSTNYKIGRYMKMPNLSKFSHQILPYWVVVFVVSTDFYKF